MEFWDIAIITLTCIGIALLTYWISYRRFTTKINHLLDGMEDGEMNFRFHEVNRLNRALNRLKNILNKQRLENEQDSWAKLIRILTHEIMNALTPVVTLADAMKGNVMETEEDKETVKESLHLISDSSVKLMEFIGNYRTVSGIAKPMRKKIDLSFLITDVIKLNTEMFSQNGINCNMNITTPDCFVFIDDLQIRRVFQNIINNAIQAGSTEIDIIIQRLTDSSLVVYIKNNGTPIPADVRSLIFTPFYTTKKEGTGIGLNVCRQIMKNHNGTIDLLYSSSKTTVFEIGFY